MRIKYISLIIILCLFITGCGNNFSVNTIETDGNGWYNGSGLNNVSVIIKERTLTKSSVTIIITDNNDPHYEYGQYYRIEKLVNDIWNEVDKKNEDNFNMMAYHVDKDNKLEMDIDWGYIYGELNSGTYRIVKDVCINDGCTEKKDFYVSFVIE